MDRDYLLFLKFYSLFSSLFLEKTNKKWGAAAGYSLSVDSSVLGIEGAAQAIINTIPVSYTHLILLPSRA